MCSSKSGAAKLKDKHCVYIWKAKSWNCFPLLSGEWSKEKSAWVLEYQNSCASAQAALDELASIQASTNEYSGIYTTVSALSRVLPKGSPVIVFSDLENSADITVDGSLAGSPVFAVQPYIHSDMELEEQFKREFIEYLVTMGVSESDVKFFAPEQAHDALTAALNWPTEA